MDSISKTNITNPTIAPNISQNKAHCYNKDIVLHNNPNPLTIREGFSRNKYSIFFETKCSGLFDIEEARRDDQGIAPSIYHKLTGLKTINCLLNSKYTITVSTNCRLYLNLNSKVTRIKSEDLTSHFKKFGKVFIKLLVNSMRTLVYRELMKIDDLAFLESYDLTQQKIPQAIPKNHESYGYILMRLIKTASGGKTKYINDKTFYFKKIISLADGANPAIGTAKNIRDALNSVGLTGVAITSADLDIASRKNIVTDDSLEKSITGEDFTASFNIKIAFIDNTIPFSTQNIKEKYDLIIMRKGLCLCPQLGNLIDGRVTSCGGIEVLNSDAVYSFLTNVASILDKEKPDSLAVLEGVGSNMEDIWTTAIDKFNSENQGELIAEIAKNRTGLSRGIIIRTGSLQMHLELLTY